MKSKISASLPFSKQIVSNPRCFRELKKFNFICSPAPVPPLAFVPDVVGLVMVSDSLELTSMEAAVFFSLLRRSPSVLVTTLEKLLLVIDWLEVEEVAVEDEVHVDPGDDHDLIARQ